MGRSVKKMLKSVKGCSEKDVFAVRGGPHRMVKRRPERWCQVKSKGENSGFRHISEEEKGQKVRKPTGRCVTLFPYRRRQKGGQKGSDFYTPGSQTLFLRGAFAKRRKRRCWERKAPKWDHLFVECEEGGLKPS